jgi:hypothetical protein
MHFDEVASAPGTPSPPHSGTQTPAENLPRDTNRGSTQARGGKKHKFTGMLAHANHSLHSLKSMGNNLTGTKSTPSSGAETPTTEGEQWDEKLAMREREKAREKRKKEEKRKKKKREAFVSNSCLPTSAWI